MKSLIFIATFAALSAATAQDKILKAGAATSNITPDLGGLVVGGFHPFPCTHIHDEIQVRCLALDNGETKLVWAVCDLVGADRGVYDLAAKYIEEETGVPRANVMMSATHTHSACSALGSDRFAMPRPPLDDYQNFVARRIADGVRRALNNLQPAKIGWAVGSEPDQVFNRRWFMKPGTVPVNPFGEVDQVKMNPPRGSPDLVKPAGPTDPEICLLSIQTREGKPLAVLANYSLHYVGGVGNGQVSADYFAVFCDRLQQLLGADRQEPPFVAIISNGTSGNINNIDFSRKAEKSEPYAKIKQVADDVARAAFDAMQGIAYRDWVPLKAAFREMETGSRKATQAQIEYANEVLAKPRLIGKPDSLEMIYAERTLSMAKYPDKISLPLQAFRIGDVGVFASPCETFVEIGLELKEKSPFKPSFTVSIANGYFGYLPTPEHHKLGGYETWLGTNRVEPQTSVKLTKTLLEMMEGLK